MWTLAEIREILEDDTDNNDEIDVVYVPPPVDTLTDGEDVDDNLMGDIDEDLDRDIAGTFEIAFKGKGELGSEITQDILNEPSQSNNLPFTRSDLSPQPGPSHLAKSEVST